MGKAAMPGLGGGAVPPEYYLCLGKLILGIFMKYLFQIYTVKMGKAAIPGLGGGVVPPEANITQRTQGSFTCSEVTMKIF